MQTFRLPEEMELDKNFQQEILSEIRKTLHKLAGKLNIKNADEQQPIMAKSYEDGTI